MKITFIYPDVIGSANYGGIFNIGIGLLSGVLKKAGYETSLIHITQPIQKSDFVKHLAGHNAELYAFSCTTPMFHYVADWAKWIKEHDKGSKILIGGVHAILNPQEVLETGLFDYVCTSEGEFPLLELCDALKQNKDTYKIDSIWSVVEGKIIRNKTRPLINDLDALPFADRTIFNYPQLMEGREKMFFVMASRGCPYNCPYCCNESLRQSLAEKQKWVRFRTVDNVIEEIKQVLKLYPNTQFIGFYDDILALKKDWFRQFTDKYKAQIKLPFRCNMRAEYLAQEEITKMMHEAGCRRVIIGLESGNEDIRNGILKRNMPEDIMLKAGSLCKKYGIEFATFNMVGLPGEGPRQLLDTVKLNAKLNSDFTYTSIFYPFPKTALHKICDDQNLLTDRIVTDYVEGTCLHFDKITIARIVYVRNFFRSLMNIYRFIYRLPKGLSRFCENVFDGFLCSKIVALTWFRFCNGLFSFLRENKIMADMINGVRRMAKKRKISSFKTSIK
jgi:radical SAM superfamily enzyme YgiQ (UPF0313 family)